ncbi:AAA family ATPase [uncultured Sphingomonas sp.]|uniref:AAA family ATPase n=1 Tax=uncultured Sphingomonas sp. TaxID=158754 RepID=UPI0025F0AE31|nr:AAA family ATPase [uncultured Sphingomonas sp.]
MDAGDYQLETADSLSLSPFSDIRNQIDKPAGSDRSSDAYWAAYMMLRDGFSEAQVMGVLMNPANAVAAHCIESDDPERAATRALSAAKKNQRERGAEEAGEAGAGSRAADSGAGAPGTAGGREAQPLALTDAGTREGKAVPDQPWVIRKLIPDRQVTLFTARGGGGKSHISFFMAGAVALGLPAFGFATTRGPAIYLTCEDDKDENDRRLIGVANGLNVSLGQFSDSLAYASLVDRRDKGIARLDQNTNKLHIEPLFHELRATLLSRRPKLVILDNVAHLFEGNENIRAHVAAFLGLLNSLALEADCAIVLIGHPNKAGDSFSGSTAFQNQVRSHIHLEVDEDDPDRRKLTLAKANYARLEEPVILRWHRGAFRHENDVPDDDPSRFSALHQRQDELFLACLAKMTEQQLPASHSPNAGNYAPKVFATMPEARGLKPDELAKVMARLTGRGLIEVGELDFDRPGSAGHKARGLRRTNRVEEADDEPF